MAKSNHRTVGTVVRTLSIVALAISAYAHLKLASDYDHPAGGSISQGTLFQIEGVLAILSGILLAVRTDVISWGAAFALLLGSFVAVNLYRYGNLGEFLFLPDMRDKTWTSTDNLKAISAVAEGIGTLTAGFGLANALRRGRHGKAAHSD